MTVETCTGYCYCLTEFGWCGGGQLERRRRRLAERRTVSESRFRTPCSDGWFATQSRNLGLASAKNQWTYTRKPKVCNLCKVCIAFFVLLTEHCNEVSCFTRCKGHIFKMCCYFLTKKATFFARFPVEIFLYTAIMKRYLFLTDFKRLAK